MKPHPSPSFEKTEQLAERVRETLDQLVPKDSQNPRAYLADISQEIFNTLVARAAEFFAYCPDDFCIQSGQIGGSTLVFGGTNRLIWNINYGFRPDPTYCSTKFKEQFEGEYWESIGWLTLEESSSVRLVGDAGIRDVVVPIDTRFNRLTIQGRRSKKGDGKIAEVNFLTGVEA